ncbi:MAG: SLBB domain-containing protein [Flavobacteriales bacterium]|nr:SLBB domain-containing protein [Flavobacteriales bacterium]
MKQYCKIFLIIFLFLPGIAPSSAQVSDKQLEQGKAVLEQKQVTQDEIKARLLKKGIDIENLRPDQLPGLSAEIEKAIKEIESEREQQVDRNSGKGLDGDSGADAPVVDALVDIKEESDSIAEEEVNKTVIGKATEIRQRVKEGASVEEALSEEMARSFHDNYKVSSSIYGHDIFFNKSLELYRTTQSATTPDSYILDVGDKLAINIFGVSQADLIYEIEEDGFVRPSNVPKIYLKGLSIGRAKELLRNRFRQGYVFTDGQFNVDLHTARTITVNIFGEVFQQGSYTISALNTAINALIAAGGPTDNGGVRQIEIISEGKRRYLDVYEFIRNPGVQYNYYLHDNDLIYVPRVGKRVSANGGGFRQGGLYELKEDEHFNELVEIAGGLKVNVYRELVQHISRAREEQEIRDFTYEQASRENIKLADNDIVILRTSSIRYKNYVQISGSVRHPGQFELTEGMKLKHILDKAVFEPETFADVAFLRRRNTDGTYRLIRLYPKEVLRDSSSSGNILLDKEDVITVYAKSSFTDRYAFSIQGAVRQPARYDWDPDKNITLYDAIVMSKGLKPEAVPFGYIISTPTDNTKERTYRMIDAVGAFTDPSSPANITIQPNDIIVIPNKMRYSDQFYVEVSGAVRSPGRYIYDPSLNFYDVLTMAGGLKLEAASNKIDIFRLKINENEPTYTYATTVEIKRDYDPLQSDIGFVLQPFDHIVVRTNPEFEPIKYVTITGEVKYPGIYAILEDNERVRSLIERAGGVTREGLPQAGTFVRNDDGIGLIVTRLDKVLKRSWSKYNISLKRGDHIHIPKLVDIVKVNKIGTNAEDIYTENQLAADQLNVVVNYRPRRAGWYVRKFAGGFDRMASKRKTFVVHPNGEIKRTVRILVFNIYPKVRMGSEINLEFKRKFEKVKKDKVRKIRNQKGEEVEIPDLVAEEAPKEKTDWVESSTRLMMVISALTASTTSAISTIILIRQL